MSNPSKDKHVQHTDILLLAGFLGAGKTTLLKRILSWQADLSDTVVIVNEFGDVGIDGMILKSAGSDVVELTNGCICCTLSADLNQSLSEIRERFQPRRVIIESSGVADPLYIIKALDDPDLARNMSMHKIVTVLDAVHWQARRIFGRLFFHQLEMANLILLNKVDCVDEADVAVYLKEIHSAVKNTQVVPTTHCRVDSETLWSGPSREQTDNPAMRDVDPEAEALDHEHTAGFVGFSFTTTSEIDEKAFQKFVENLPLEMFRMKGPVCFSDRAVMVNHVGGNTDYQPWDGDRETRLAFVGWHVDSEKTTQELRGCITN